MKSLLKQLFLRHTRCYEINSQRKSKASSGSAGESKNEPKGLQCRHVVALMGFAVFFFMNVHRMNMTISIVAMVNSSEPRSDRNNKTSESCPSLAHPPNETLTSSLPEKVNGEFDWTPELEGFVLGSSFFGYFLTQLVGGKLSEIFGCKWIIFWGVLFASLATLATPFVSWWNVYMLIAVQTVRGMAQGVFQPSISVLAANWFPAAERGCLFSLMMSGYGGGVVAGGLITGYLCQAPFAGWPFVFYSCGTAGILFALALAVFLSESPSVHPGIAEKELKLILSDQESKLSNRRPDTPWRSILASTPVYALSFAIFGQFWAGTHFLAIHPTFLGTILHFPISQNGLFTSLPFLLQTIFTIIASLISNTLNKNSYASVSKVRKSWNFMACLGYSACLIGIYFAQCNGTMIIVFSFLAMASLGFAYAGCMIVAADMTPTFAGSVMGLASTAGSTSGFILPFVAGFLTDGDQTLEQWDKILFISIGIVMSSGISFCIFGSAETQTWNYVEDKNPVDEEKQKTNDVKY